VDYGVGVLEERGVLAGFEDVGTFPGYFVRPGWRVGGGGYGRPDWFTRAAGKSQFLPDSLTVVLGKKRRL
jgi:hypothetical protein